MKWFLIYINQKGVLTNKLVQAENLGQTMRIANEEED